MNIRTIAVASRIRPTAAKPIVLYGGSTPMMPRMR